MTRFLLLVAATSLVTTCSEGPDVIGPSDVPSAWAAYTDQVLGFSIRHPETLQSTTISQAPSDQAPIAIDAPAPGVPVDPETYRQMKDQARLQQVSFQAAGVAPTLIIEIFRKDPATSLRIWLQSFGVIASGTDGRAVHSSGAGEGIRVGDDTWYFAGVAQVYALTIRGPDADRILGSFRVLAGR